MGFAAPAERLPSRPGGHVSFNSKYRRSGRLSVRRAAALEEAIEWVKRAPNCSSNGESEVEIRKVMDLEDFGDGFTPNPEIAKVKIK